MRLQLVVPSWFVRCFVGGSERWFKQGTVGDGICKSLFGMDADDRSVFLVDSEKEETLAAAAYYCSLKRDHTVPCLLLRIRRPDLKGLVKARCRSGSTGIKGVDAIHHDLLASYNSLEQSIERAADAFVQGEDRVRIVGRSQLRRQLQVYSEASDEDVSAIARRYCMKALTK